MKKARQKNFFYCVAVRGFFLLLTLVVIMSKSPAQAPLAAVSGYSPGVYPTGTPAVGTGNFFGIAYQSSTTGNLVYSISFNGSYINPVDSGFPMSSPSVAVANYYDTSYVIFMTAQGFQVTTVVDGQYFSNPQPININGPVGYLDQMPSLTVLSTANEDILYLSFSCPTAGGMTVCIASSTDGVNYGNEIFPTPELIEGGTSLATFQVNGSGYADLAVAYTSTGYNNSGLGIHYPAVAYSSDEQTFQVTDLTSFGINGDPAISSYTNTNYSQIGGSEPALYIFGMDAYSGYPASSGTYNGSNFTSVTDIPGTTNMSSSISAAYTNDTLVIGYLTGQSGSLQFYTLESTLGSHGGHGPPQTPCCN